MVPRLLTFLKHNISNEKKLEIQFAESFLFQDSAKFMGWKIGNNGFEMMLSSELPKIILKLCSTQSKGNFNSKGNRYIPN